MAWGDLREELEELFGELGNREHERHMALETQHAEERARKIEAAKESYRIARACFPELLRERRRESHRRMRLDPEFVAKVRAKYRAYHARHREEIVERRRQRYAAHAEEARAKDRERYDGARRLWILHKRAMRRIMERAHVDDRQLALFDRGEPKPITVRVSRFKRAAQVVEQLALPAEQNFLSDGSGYTGKLQGKEGI